MMTSRQNGLRFFVGILFVGVLFCGCSRYNSEFATPRPLAIPSQKPTCDFKPEANCWMADMEALRNCLLPSESGQPEYFTDDNWSCGNFGGKKMIFDFTSKTKLDDSDADAYPGALEFIIYSRSNPCFKFRGSEDSFEIQSETLGNLTYKRLSTGDVRVQCFSGEVISFASEPEVKGCESETQQKIKLTPRMELAREPSDLGSSLSMSFFGFFDGPYRMFHCLPGID